MHTAYASSQVFCLPTRLNAFGTSFVEAVVHGLPCIGPDAWRCPKSSITAGPGFSCHGRPRSARGGVDRDMPSPQPGPGTTAVVPEQTAPLPILKRQSFTAYEASRPQRGSESATYFPHRD